MLAESGPGTVVYTEFAPGLFGLYMHIIFMFDDVHDENTFEGSQIFDAAQHIQDETLVVFHVGSMNLQQVIETARYVVAFGDLRNIGDDPGKFGGYIVIYPLQLDFTKDHKTLVQFIGIQYGDVLLDIAVRF